MNIVILGAGEVGKQLAWTLSTKRNSVAVVDSRADRLARLQDHLDVMTVQGDCADFSVLKKAGIHKAELLVAASGSDPSNVLACQIARHLGVGKTICRLSSRCLFSAEDGFSADLLGIDHVILPAEKCIRRILRVLQHQCLVERVDFSVQDAQMSCVRVAPGSVVAGVRLADFPDRELVSSIRFSAIVRNQRLLIPRGDTVLAPGDEVYVAGPSANVEALFDLVDDESRRPSLVLVAGATRMARVLIPQLLADGYQVRVIEESRDESERFLDELGEGVMVIQGSATDARVLEEAGIGECGAFISVLRDDEKNILSCILAKEQGARKVVAVTNKAEYMDIVPALKPIDCGFSPRLGAVNTVLNLLGSETGRVHAMLHRTHAYVYEFRVAPGSRLCGQRIADHTDGFPAALALVLRGDQVLPATGDAVLEEGDRVAAIATPEHEQHLAVLFRKPRLFG
ncbi:MAG: Trk system potassium transporter TrkA [Lentisphaeria bacterium]|nr:Trk system potassium transporter TrkA [Lentisphaeria bacterium]